MEQLTLSPEQTRIVQNICNRKNVLAICKAGTGKTTVGLACSLGFYEKYQQRALLITYNARLKNETREKIKTFHLESIVECHSYHAAAYKFFLDHQVDSKADDSLIYAALQQQPKKALEFGLIIIDENQDMNQLYYEFTIHLLSALKEKPTLLLVGDIFQKLFGFNGATDKFITSPKEYFGTFCYETDFAICHLSISWRISHEMAAFINSNLNPINLQHSVDPTWWQEHGDKIIAFWGKGIRASPNRPPSPNSVKIIRGWRNSEAIKQAKAMLQTFGNDNVAFLALSLKSPRSPIRSIVDKLGKNDTENWILLDGKQNASEEIIKGKCIAATIHRFKGLERKGILYGGMDSWIETVCSDPTEPFNYNYVACTRAKDQLVVIVCGTDYATVRCGPLRKQSVNMRQSCQVRDLVEYVPFEPVLSMKDELFHVELSFEDEKRRVVMAPQSFLIPGRTPGTAEDLAPFLNRAIALKLMWLMQHDFSQVSLD